jgi:Uncharacterized conserved protein
MDHYLTISKLAEAEYKDRGSRFIAVAIPLSTKSEFKPKITEIKEKYPKASHYCFAYRLGADKLDYRVSDDGEPSGTAGRQILGEIDSKNLTDIAVVVVRYFGGTLLGIPGLINAYKTATSLVLQIVPIEQKQILINYKIQFPYTIMNEVMMIMKRNECFIIKNSQELFCNLEVGIPKNKVEFVLGRLKELREIEVEAF